MSFQATNLPSTRFGSNCRGTTIVGCCVAARRSNSRRCCCRQEVFYGQRILFRSRRFGGSCLEEYELEVYRRHGDDTVDRVLELLAQEGRPLGDAQDLIQLAAAAASASQAASLPTATERIRSRADQELARFYNSYTKLPSWVDATALERGQQVFLTYLPSMVRCHCFTDPSSLA
jgi:hypothetical protein